MPRKVLVASSSFPKKRESGTGSPIKAFGDDKKNSVQDLFDWAYGELKFLGEDEAGASIERLLQEILGLDRIHLYLEAKKKVRPNQIVKFKRLVRGRKARVPLAYLLKKVPFWNEVLSVSPDCLIPRPETEILVEKFIETGGFKRADVFSFLDLGAGSGAIGIALLRHFPNARATFSDISHAALRVTRKNLAAYDLLNRAELVRSDVFSTLREMRWDAILSNPPYLSAQDLRKIEPELKAEPKCALYGGPDGLEFYRRLIQEAPNFLQPGGILILEMGRGQVRAILSLIDKKNSYKETKVFKDHAGIDRVCMARVINHANPV
jgi:release factor glutamine methyltransferase